MKILHLNDLHADTSGPESRTDNYFDAIKNKLEVVKDILFRESIDVICCTGDLFHKKDPSRVPYKLFNYLRQYFTSFLDKKVYIRMIYGNHDKRSDLKEFWPSQPMNTLINSLSDHSEYFKYSGVPEIRFPDIIDDVVFIGIDHSYAFDSIDFDFLGFKEALKVAVSVAGDKKIVFMIHQALHPDKVSYPFFTRKISSLSDLNIDYILCGHLHENYGITEYEKNKYFINCGSIMRGSIHEHNLNRIPTVCVVDTSKNEFKQYPLTDKKAEDVFDLARMKKEEDISNEISEFASKLNNFSIDENSTSLDSSVLEDEEQKFVYDCYMDSVGSSKASRRESINMHFGFEVFK